MDENTIRQRAYEIWEQEGRPEGRHEDHWHRASEEANRQDDHADAAPGGISSPLHPGGTLPGGSPAAGAGSLGTGGGSTADRPTGSKASRG